MAKRAWVSIEVDLPDHPKVRAIAKAISRPPFYCVGALARVWGEVVKFGEMDGEDMILRGRDIYEIDRLAQRRGFSSALMSVGWMRVIDTETLLFPLLKDPLFFESILSERVRKKEAERKRRNRVRDSAIPETSADSPRKQTGKMAHYSTVTVTEQLLETTDVVSSPTRPAKPREPDPIWDTLCETFGLKPVTKPECSRVGRLVRDLKAKSAAAVDIGIRAARWRRIHPEDKFNTPEALVKHWDELAKEPSNATNGQSGIGRIKAPAGTDYDAIARRKTERLFAADAGDDVPGAPGQGTLLLENSPGDPPSDSGVP